MLEAATPENLSWIDDIARQTPDSIAALTNETGAYVDYEADLVALDGKHTPSAQVVAMGKHLMFCERS